MKKRLLNINFYFLASLLFGSKTYIAYRFFFNMTMENYMQEVILLINAFAIVFFLLSFSIWLNGKKQLKYIRFLTLIGTLIIYFNLLFYRNLNDFLTLPVLFQGSNAADIGTTTFASLRFYDLFLFLDLIIICFLPNREKPFGRAHV